MTRTVHPLRLVVSDNTGNLFVRLHPQTVERLAGDSVDFLPLSITIEEKTIFASWNGGFANAAGSIEIPNTLLAGIPNFPTNVVIRVLSRTSRCKQAHFEPKNAEDWELLESYADSLEAGLLLKQISVVYSQQRLSLRIQNDRIEVLVKKIVLEQDGSGDPHQVAGNDSSCALLVQDTEIIISPKQRQQCKAVDWSASQRLIPCRDDWNEAMLQLHSLMGLSPHEPPFFSVVVSDTIWDSRYEWALLRADDTAKASQQLVRVISDDSIPNGQAAMHPLIRLDLGLDLYWGSVQLRPTSAPEDSPIETMVVRPILFKEARLLPAYRRPPLGEPMATSPSLPSSEQVWIPLNSIVPQSWFAFGGNAIDSADPLHQCYVRLCSRTDCQTGAQADEVARQLSSAFLVVPDASLAIAEFSKDEKGENTVTTMLHQSQLDCLVNSLSQPVVSSTSWADSILNDLRTNSRTTVILCGPTGCGKTYCSLLLCAMARLQQSKASLYLDCKILKDSSSSLGDILNELDSVFDQASRTQECVVILDDFDRIAPNVLGGDDDNASGRVQSANPIAISQSKVIADRLLQLLEGTSSSGVSIVLTSASMESINTSLHRLGAFRQRHFDVPLLSETDRLGVLGQMMNRRFSDPSSRDFATVKRRTETFSPRDLEKIARRAENLLRFEDSRISVADALERVLDQYTPLSHLSLSKNNIEVSPNWASLGGLFKIKARLESTIMHPVKYKLIYEQAAISLPRGILLFGPPGCGKSALVPALAEACKFPLISCKGPEVLDKYIGASEAKIRELFKRASDVAPSILFLDELDALAPRRGSDHTGVTDRVVNQLLTFLDGVEDSSKSTVYVIGATSRPDKVDSALVRPGRLEQHLYVGPPTTEDELCDLFTKLLKNWNLSADCQDFISSKAKVHAVLSEVSGIDRFSPADLRAALETAHVNAVHRLLETAAPEDIEKVEISKEDLTLALQTTRPSLNGYDAGELTEIYSAFKGEKSSRTKKTKLMTTLK